MPNEVALKTKFARMETSVLLDMWTREDRLDWAEALLRSELLSRNVAEDELTRIASKREEIARSQPPSSMDTIVGFGILGRAAAVFLAVVAGNVAGGLFGYRWAILAVAAIALGYSVIMIARLHHQFARPTGAMAGAVMVYQYLEIVVVVALVAYGVWLAFA